MEQEADPSLRPAPAKTAGKAKARGTSLGMTVDEFSQRTIRASLPSCVRAGGMTARFFMELSGLNRNRIAKCGILLAQEFVDFVGGVEFLFEFFAREVVSQMIDGLGEAVERARCVLGVGQQDVAPDIVGASR
jgi:hypothetical protein